MVIHVDQLNKQRLIGQVTFTILIENWCFRHPIFSNLNLIWSTIHDEIGVQ